MTDVVPSEASLLQPGQIFAGKYRVKKYLAKGAMGAVFVGEHVTTELLVAIKVLFVSNDPKQNSLQALTEAKVAGRVRSENIVQVQDAGIDPETKLMYLVMELLEGKTLEQLVESNGPLPPQEVVLYLRQVASGLDKAHNYKTPEGPQPIVHRDLKPENLFLAHRDDGSPLIKILDFGIAKVLSKETSKATQQPKGTPLYMAPEQLALSGISPATDIWALGLIAFFLMTGRSYWRSASDENASIYSLFAEIGAPKVGASERAREMRLNPSWPQDFDDWFLRMLAADPAERFSSASAAIDALGAVLGVGLTARPSLSEPLSVPSVPRLSAEPPPSAVPPASVAPVQSPGRAAPEVMKSSLPGLSITPEKERATRWWKPAVVVGVLVSAGLLVAMKLREPSVPQEGRLSASAQAASALPSSTIAASAAVQEPPGAGSAPAASASAQVLPKVSVAVSPKGPLSVHLPVLPQKNNKDDAPKNTATKPPIQPPQNHGYNPLD